MATCLADFNRSWRRMPIQANPRWSLDSCSRFDDLPAIAYSVLMITYGGVGRFAPATASDPMSPVWSWVLSTSVPNPNSRQRMNLTSTGHDRRAQFRTKSRAVLSCLKAISLDNCRATREKVVTKVRGFVREIFFRVFWTKLRARHNSSRGGNFR
jgi:hypothetical protein